MLQPGAKRHQDEAKRAGKKLERKDCEKTEKFGVFSSIDSHMKQK
jgi:hypothetical protein